MVTRLKTSISFIEDKYTSRRIYNYENWQLALSRLPAPPSLWSNAPHSGQISMKFCIGGLFYWKSLRIVCTSTWS